MTVMILGIPTMKTYTTLLSGAAALMALGAGLWFSQTTAQAQCTPAATGGPDTVTCTGPAAGYIYDALGGDDSISISGDFSNTSSISASTGNDTINNSGNFNLSAIYGDANNDSISNSGSFSNNSVIAGDAGDDIISLLPGSAFDATSWVDGDFLSATTGNSDLLILYVETPVNFDTKFPLCHGQVNVAAMQAAGCFVPWEGGVLYFTNFEKIQVILIEALAAQGISVSLPAGPQVICDDGRVKVFKLPNGDVEYYSGFDRVNVPNGFMVARVSLLDLANGVRTFPAAAQTPNPLGWRVVITQTGNALSGQVVDADGTQVGGGCRH
jgi:hypothetical protein